MISAVEDPSPGTVLVRVLASGHFLHFDIASAIASRLSEADAE
jgi:hypothetical protein